MGSEVQSSGTIVWVNRKAFFHAGDGTLKVPMSMHKDNRSKLLAALRKREEIPADAVVVLQGGEELSVYDTDTEWDFKQESNFQYLFGVKEPGCWGAIRISDGYTVLFVPSLPQSYAAWMGPVLPPAWFQRAYEVDEVNVLEDPSTLAKVVRTDLKATAIVFPEGSNRDSGIAFKRPALVGLEDVPVPDGACRAMHVELAEARLIKSADELKVMQFVNDVSSLAHIETMRTGAATRPGAREYVAAATFKYQASLRGCMRTGYPCICPVGPRNTYLHYGHTNNPNAEAMEAGALTLRDMGAEYHGYSADVTCTYPLSGQFTQEQRNVYEAVWAAVQAVEHTIRPGVCYKDMHRLAQRTMLEELKKVGLFVGDVDGMMKVNLMHHFMFHGLGHSLGLDVHDVGGYEPGVSRTDDPSIEENLRLGRTLQEGMVITVEPGCYFTPFLLEQALADDGKACFINRECLDAHRSVGGVRIEDDVVITATGCRVLTNVPRTVQEIEAVMAGQQWVVSPSTCREYSNGQLI